MKYGIIKNINGNYSVHAEGITSISAAKTMFHGLCQTLWNAPSVITGHFMIVDENLNCVEGYREYIHHDAPAGTEEPEQGE